MQKAEWWENFFSDLAVDMWRQATTDDQTRKETDFVEASLQVTPPATVLDVPCGAGRLSIELASRGFTVTGVDVSAEFMDEARLAASNRQAKISWHRRDMRDLPWSESFDGVFCVGNSFGFLDDEGNTRFLEAVHRALKPAGRFVLDASSVAENVLPKIQPHTEMRVGDILFIEENLTIMNTVDWIPNIHLSGVNGRKRSWGPIAFTPTGRYQACLRKRVLSIRRHLATFPASLSRWIAGAVCRCRQAAIERRPPMSSHARPTFVKVLQTDSLTDIAQIKSVLDAGGVRYFIQGENMKFLRPVDSAILMVAERDAHHAIELLTPLKLHYNWIVSL